MEMNYQQNRSKESENFTQEADQQNKILLKRIVELSSQLQKQTQAVETHYQVAQIVSRSREQSRARIQTQLDEEHMLQPLTEGNASSLESKESNNRNMISQRTQKTALNQMNHRQDAEKIEYFYKSSSGQFHQKTLSNDQQTMSLNSSKNNNQSTNLKMLARLNDISHFQSRISSKSPISGAKTTRNNYNGPPLGLQKQIGSNKNADIITQNKKAVGNQQDINKLKKVIKQKKSPKQMPKKNYISPNKIRKTIDTPINDKNPFSIQISQNNFQKNFHKSKNLIDIEDKQITYSQSFVQDPKQKKLRNQDSETRFAEMSPQIQKDMSLPKIKSNQSFNEIKQQEQKGRNKQISHSLYITDSSQRISNDFLNIQDSEDVYNGLPAQINDIPSFDQNVQQVPISLKPKQGVQTRQQANSFQINQMNQENLQFQEESYTNLSRSVENSVQQNRDGEENFQGALIHQGVPQQLQNGTMAQVIQRNQQNFVFGQNYVGSIQATMPSQNEINNSNFQREQRQSYDISENTIKMNGGQLMQNSILSAKTHQNQKHHDKFDPSLPQINFQLNSPNIEPPDDDGLSEQDRQAFNNKSQNLKNVQELKLVCHNLASELQKAHELIEYYQGLQQACFDTLASQQDQKSQLTKERDNYQFQAQNLSEKLKDKNFSSSQNKRKIQDVERIQSLMNDVRNSVQEINIIQNSDKKSDIKNQIAKFKQDQEQQLETWRLTEHDFSVIKSLLKRENVEERRVIEKLLATLTAEQQMRLKSEEQHSLIIDRLVNNSFVSQRSKSPLDRNL